MILNRSQVLDILDNVLETKVVQASRVKSDVQFCCTIHKESNPSAGFNVEKGVFNCFSCRASGNISWLLFKSLDQFKSLKQADEFLAEKYGLDLKRKYINKEKTELPRFESFTKGEERKREEVPISFIAPFKSGLETYRYFYNRGFNYNIVKEFMIGRDLKNKTITIPIFWEDNKLAGVIGRYVSKDRKKNQRYKIYDFPVSKIVFPLNKLETINDTLIGVEGTLDAIRMHQLGYTNTFAILGNTISKDQAEIIKSRCSKFIDMFDNDERGKTASESARKNLGTDILYYSVSYLEGKKDPCDCTKEEIEEMIRNKKSKLDLKINRL